MGEVGLSQSRGEPCSGRMRNSKWVGFGDGANKRWSPYRQLRALPSGVDEQQSTGSLRNTGVCHIGASSPRAAVKDRLIPSGAADMAANGYGCPSFWDSGFTTGSGNHMGVPYSRWLSVNCLRPVPIDPDNEKVTIGLWCCGQNTLILEPHACACEDQIIVVRCFC